MLQKPFSKRSLTYEQALERLYQIGLFRRGKAVNHCTPILDRVLGAPAKAFPSIHIAGTNGKGSVAIKIAKTLELSGLKVGLFTSPHLLSFCERISINGILISKDDVSSGFETLFNYTKTLRLKPTFFELVTNLACLYFKEREVDIAVFEVGLGGKTDATNVIEPILSVITSIGNDHNWVLGETLELIAEQKAGIIRNKTPVVLGPTVRFDSVDRIIREKEAPAILVEKCPGNFEDENRSIAKAALQSLKAKYALNDAVIERGIKTIPPCRFQEVDYLGIPVVVDVAHNPDAIDRLFQAISVRFPGKSIQVIFGIASDKDHARCLTVLASKVRRIYLPQMQHERLAPADVLIDILSQQQFNHAIQVPSVEEALQLAYKNAKEHGDLILICGSFYLMESVLPLLENSNSISSVSA